jgi:hypothetical protein
MGGNFASTMMVVVEVQESPAEGDEFLPTNKQNKRNNNFLHRKKSKGSTSQVRVKFKAASTNFSEMSQVNTYSYRGTLQCKIAEKRRQQREYKISVLGEALLDNDGLFQELYEREKIRREDLFKELSRVPPRGPRQKPNTIPWPSDSQFYDPASGKY